ncbi:hypothetical protein BKA70DRAFT_1522407 [Coprinopsis sp. MPI-PUGE-AT-0042]|nr:hypothetical protein BKA70DRAFT_1522407 [Coprinopsis sp. MPI-PUGE-AT-0042]
MKSIEGQCLCGETTITIEDGQSFNNQTSGSAYSVNILAPKKDVKIKGLIKEYDVRATSGNVVTRVFCRTCGSAISHLSVGYGDAQAIQTGDFRSFADIPAC